jgi:RNA polymerase-interacting CarD/CdnL/TRCF family regulator
VIDIPSRELTVHIPASKADNGGLRPAMSECRRQRLLGMLSGRPHALPEGFKERRALIDGQLQTGRTIQLARVVRDLTGRRLRSGLNRTDADSLRKGRYLLAAEMALISGDSAKETAYLIDAALSGGAD